MSGPRPTTYDSVQTLLQSILPNELRSILGGIRARKDREREEAGANQTHYCNLCEKSYTSSGELERHSETPLHLRRVERGEKELFVHLVVFPIQTRLATTDTANQPSIAGMLANKTSSSDPTTDPRALQRL